MAGEKITIVSVDSDDGHYWRSGKANNLTSVTLATSPEIGSCKLDDVQTVNYLLGHYALGYTSFSPVVQPTGLLPPGVKATFSNLVIFERPPTYQNIFYIPDTVHSLMRTRPSVYRVALPWQLYAAVYNSDYYLNAVYMYFMDAPLTSVDQKVYAPNIPNFYANGQLCRPTFAAMEDVDRYSKDVSGVIHSAFDWIWNNGTNHDLTESMVLLPRYADDLSKTVIGQISKSNFYFCKSSLVSHKLSPEQVHAAFTSWETIDIKEILNYEWATPSLLLHDTNYSNQTIQIIVESNAYSEHLESWLNYTYEGESEGHIEDRSLEGDYDQSEYIQYLLSNGYVVYPEKKTNVSYSDMLQVIFQKNNTLKRKTINILSDVNKIFQISSEVS